MSGTWIIYGGVLAEGMAGKAHNACNPLDSVSDENVVIPSLLHISEEDSDSTLGIHYCQLFSGQQVFVRFD